MKPQIIRSFDSTILLETNSDRLATFLKDSKIPRTLIPAYEYYLNLENNPDFRVILEDANNTASAVSLDMAERKFFCRSNFKQNISDYQLSYLLLYFFQRLYQEKSNYSVHGSAISSKDNGVLIVGPENAGKTITSLKLAIDYNFKFEGDECVIIGGEPPKILAGATFPQLDNINLKFLDRDFDFHGAELNSHSTKTILDSRKDGIYGGNSPKINYIYFIHICPYNPEKRELPLLDQKNKMYLETSLDVRGSGYVLMNLGFPMPSLDTEEIAKRRLVFCSSLIDQFKPKVFKIRGSLDDVCKDINDAVKNGRN